MANLAALLDKEASAEIQTILSEARARASEIVSRAEEEAEATVAARQRTATGQHEAALVRARSSAQLEASSLKLRAQHRAVEGVFDAAQKEIDALINDGKRYPAVLKDLLKEAADGMRGGRDNIGAVVVNPKEKAAAEKAVKEVGLNAPVETDERVRGGVRLRAKEGHVSLENTLPERLASLRDDLASDVSRLLFSDDKAA